MAEKQERMLKQLLADCGIGQAELARALAGTGRSTINQICNAKPDYWPVLYKDFAKDVEAFLRPRRNVQRWLEKQGIKMSGIWNIKSSNGKRHEVAGRGKRIWKSRKAQAIQPGDPAVITEREVEMLTGEAMKHFKLFRSPFLNDIRGVEDIYLSDEHRYIEAAMLDAAKHAGFIAVIGEVGSGKSVMRKKVVAELAKDVNSRIIYPRMIDKSRVTAASICDAIVLDLSDEVPKMRLEQKTRQVERLLISRLKASCHVCLIIEEAHDLTVRVLKLLKRFYEIEDVYQKALGIVLIGQPELSSLFNEADHYEMREVIRRCQVAVIRGLNGNVKPYLEMKFSRVKVKADDIITDEAIEALSERLMDKDPRSGRPVSHAYPLSINNWIVLAMNLATELGEKKVTAEVIAAL